MRLRRMDDKCWCGRLRREHVNGKMCDRYLPPSYPRSIAGPLQSYQEKAADARRAALDAKDPS